MALEESKKKNRGDQNWVEFDVTLVIENEGNISMFWEKTHSWIERKWKLILIPSVWMNFLSISNEQIFYHNNKEIKQNIYLTGMPNLKIIIEQYVF